MAEESWAKIKSKQKNEKRAYSKVCDVTDVPGDLTRERFDIKETERSLQPALGQGIELEKN